MLLKVVHERGSFSTRSSWGLATKVWLGAPHAAKAPVTTSSAAVRPRSFRLPVMLSAHLAIGRSCLIGGSSIWICYQRLGPASLIESMNAPLSPPLDIPLADASHPSATARPRHVHPSV